VKERKPKCWRCHKRRAVYLASKSWWYCFLCPCYFPTDAALALARGAK
jgi:hypothetical protein